MDNFPNVNITKSGFLDEVFTSFFTSENFQESKYFTKLKYGKILTEEELSERRKIFRTEWKKYEKQIFQAMYDVTSLSFKRNTIDVYFVRVTPRVFSKPIIMSGKLPLEQNMETLVHELIHVLLNESLGGNMEKLNKILTNMFPKETPLTKTHIPVYAILALVYHKVFPDIDIMKLLKSTAGNHETNDYTRALEIAENYGLEKIIRDLKTVMTK